MNWKTEAMEKLRRYDAMQKATVNIPQEISRLEDESVALRSGLAVRPVSSRDVRRREEVLLDNLVTRQQLQWSLKQARSWTALVHNALMGLDPEEQMILKQLYILPRDAAVEQLMQKLGLEKSSIYRRRDRALRKFTLSLYGTEESN